MEITFVGTGAAKSQLNRFHTSLLISKDNHKLLIDTGDGVSKALLSSNMNPNSIDSIFITHTHADHFSGIVSLLTQMKLTGRTSPLRFFIHKSFTDFITTFFNASFLFAETFDFDFKIIGFDFDSEIKLDENFNIYPMQNNHISNKHNIQNISDVQFISSSILIKDNVNTLHYSSDIDDISELSLYEKFNPDYLITESTHISFNEIIEFVKKSELKKTFLVHINDDDKIIEQYEKLSNEEKNIVTPTYDGMKITL